MIAFLSLFLHVLVSPFKTQARLEAEISVLRHQLNVLSRHAPFEAETDRRRSIDLRLALPSVPIRVERHLSGRTGDRRWHRMGFRLYWRWKSRSCGGRPRIPAEIRHLIRGMSLANRLWGAPRIHGELLKLGIEVAQSAVAKYFLVVPTIGFKLLFVLVILRHERRQLISLRVTTNPTAHWITHQITDAFPWNEAPDYLIRDRDGSYGHAVTKRLAAM